MVQEFAWMAWYRFVLLAVTLFLTYTFSSSRTGVVTISSYQKFLFFVSCYAWGKVFQMFELGPGMVRWYLSDVGFVAAVAYGYSLFAPLLGIRRSTLDNLQTGVVWGFVIALGTEAMQMAVPAEVAGFARGDWVDVQIFFVTAAYCMYLVQQTRSELRVA